MDLKNSLYGIIMTSVTIIVIIKSSSSLRFPCPSVQEVQFCIVTHIYSSVPLFIVTHNPAFTFVMYTGFHCSHLHLLCVYCHSLYNGVLLCIVHQVSQPVAIAATLSIRDFLPRHTLSCHFFVRFLIFLFSSYYSLQ